MSTIALIPAAGSGRRMRAAGNKQYLDLAGRPILAHTLQLFQQHRLIDKILVIVAAEEIPYCQTEVVNAHGFKKVAAVIAGGTERQDSVRLGLAACQAETDDLVVVHDGARPLFDPALLPALLQAAEETGAALLGVPVKDTVKLVADGLVQATPARDQLWLAQTPQAFRYQRLAEAHRSAQGDGFRGTDDASLVERLGYPVRMIAGDYRNLKVTTPEDLVVASALLQDEKERS